MRTAVELLGAHRIGHGIRAAEDVGLLRQLADEGVVCDICPTSNVRLGIIPNMREHPLPIMMGHGVAVTVNADDPLLLATTLTHEYLRVRETWNLTDHEIAHLALSGLHAAGMSDNTKSLLQIGIRQWLAEEESPRLLPYSSETNSSQKGPYG